MQTGSGAGPADAESSADSAGAQPAKGRPRKSAMRLIALLLVLVSAIAGVYFSPIRSWLQDTGLVKQWLESIGPWAYPATAISVAVLVAAGVPRLLLCALGGMVLGFLPGLLITQAGTLVGYYGVFLFVRWGGRELLIRRYPRVERLGDFIGRKGLLGVILIRQMPIHGTLSNICLGVSSLRHRNFLIGTAIGLIPEAIPVALAGAGIAGDTARETVKYLAWAGVAFLAISVASAYIYRRLKASAQGAAVMAEMSSLNEGAER